MDSEVYELSRALNSIRDLIERQKQRKTRSRDNNSINQFNDLSIDLKNFNEEKSFQTKTVKIQTKLKNSKQNKRFFAKIPENVVKEEEKRREKPKIIEKCFKKQKFYEKSEILKFIEKQRKTRANNELDSKTTHKREKSYDVIEVRKYIEKQKLKRKKRLNFDKNEEKEKNNSIKEKSEEKSEEKEEINEEIEVKEEEEIEEEKSEANEKPIIEEESPSLLARSLVERALSGVPSWDTLCERVFTSRQKDFFRLTSDLDLNLDSSGDDVTSLSCDSLNSQQLIEKYSKTIFEKKTTIEDLFLDEKQKSNAFQYFLFDFCKQFVLKEFRIHNNSNDVTLTLPLRLQKRFFPTNSQQLSQIINNELFNRKEDKLDIKSLKLMAFCRQKRKKDFIDSILHEEMAKEDPLWTHFDKEIELVKLKVSQLILRDLLLELTSFV